MLFLSLLRWSCFFILPFVNVKFHSNWFANVELSCVLEKIQLIMVYDPFYIVGFGLLLLSWGFLHLYSYQRHWPIIFFFCNVFVWFWYQGNDGLVEWIWECSVLFNFFLNSLRRLGIISSLFIWQKGPLLIFTTIGESIITSIKVSIKKFFFNSKYKNASDIRSSDYSQASTSKYINKEDIFFILQYKII